MRLAGYSGEEIAAAEAHDLVDELVAGKRLRPFVEWAGGVHLQAAQAAANQAQMEAMF